MQVTTKRSTSTGTYIVIKLFFKLIDLNCRNQTLKGKQNPDSPILKDNYNLLFKFFYFF
jgi:hypothetical protein